MLNWVIPGEVASTNASLTEEFAQFVSRKADRGKIQTAQ
jgi:hypothetical protein